MRFIFIIGLMICHNTAEARVTPTQINSSQIKEVSKQLSGVFSTKTANDPNALGVDFEIEVSTFLQDVSSSPLPGYDSTISDQFLDSIITLKKGLYWNLDFSISTVLPIPSNLVSGFSFDLEHTKKTRLLTIKSDFYISHYNLNDIINNEAVGATVLAYKRFKNFHLGLGGNFESISSSYNQSFLSSQLLSSESNKIEFLETALIAKFSTRLSSLRFTATYLYRSSTNSLYSFAVGKRF